MSDEHMRSQHTEQAEQHRRAASHPGMSPLGRLMHERAAQQHDRAAAAYTVGFGCTQRP